MPDVNIEGVGKVRLDDSFLAMSPAQQQAQIEEIVAEVGRSSASTPKSPPSAGRGGWNPTVKVIKDGRSVASKVWPQGHITQVERDPNSPLGRKNPSSWHNHTSGAIDMRPIPGMSFEEYVEGYRKAGYTIVHSKNENEAGGGKRAAHATGDHWHVVLGPKADGTEETADIPNPEPSPEPEAQVDPSLPAPEPSVPATTPEAPNNFFRMPSSMAELGKGLEYGAGSVVEGIGDTLGIVSNPLSTSLGRAMGYKGYTADLGDTLRSGLGLDRPAENDTGNRIVGDIVSGATGGLTFSGLAGTAGKATGTLVQQGLAKMAATPVADAVAGGTSSLAADGAEAAGLGPVGQTVAAIAGAGVGAGGVGLAKAASPEARATRFADKAFAADPRQAAIDARSALDIAKAAKNGNISATAAKKNPLVVSKVLNNIEQGYYSEFKSLVDKSDLHPIERQRLKALLTTKHSASPEEITAIRGTVQGDAIADAIEQVQSIRKMTEPHGRSNNGIGKVLNGAASALDMSSLAIPVPGGPLISGALRKLGREVGDQEVARIAQARKVAGNERGYTKVRELAGPAPSETSAPALWEAATAHVDGKTAKVAEAQAARQAKAAQSALARQAAEKLKAGNERVGAINLRDNIVPQDGFRATVHAKTGLKPAEQDAGALNALWKGKITPEQHDAFLNNPAALMPGNAGNSMIDRLASMADDGKLPRDPNWKPPPAQAEAPVAPAVSEMVDAKGQPIRSKPAYDAGVQKNIAREMPLLQELDQIEMQRTAQYDADPEYRKIAGSSADPHVQRIHQIRSALRAMGSPNADK